MNHIRHITKRICAGLLAVVIGVQGLAVNEAMAKETEPQKIVEEAVDVASETDAAYMYNEDAEDEFILSYRGEVDEQVESVGNMPQVYSENNITPQTAVSIPASYISPYCTEIKNQGIYGTCWAFATMAASEAAIYKKYGEVEDLSEWQLAYFTGNASVTDPLGGTAGDSFSVTSKDERYQPAYLKVGGNQICAVRSLASWRGYVQEEDAPYASVVEDEDKTLADEYAYNKDTYHLKNAYIINMTDRDEVKRMIQEYGACGAAYCHDSKYFSSEKYYSDSLYFNGEKAGGYSEYCNATEYSNHAITIIGWDDSFSKENFGTIKPTIDGAWLIKNSWGNNYSTFWISYQDAVLNSENAYAYDPISIGEDYEYNYQYDGGMTDSIYTLSSSNSLYAANVYVSNSNEELKAVGFYTLDPNYSCTISIYKDCDTDSPVGEAAVATVQTEQTYAGYHTVELPQGVMLEKDTRFSIVIEYENIAGSDSGVKVGADCNKLSDWMQSISSAKEGQSYISEDGQNWTDIGKRDSANFRIKAFTDTKEEIIAEPVKVTDISLSKSTATLTIGDKCALTATIQPENAEDKSVVWTSSNRNVATVDASGQVTAVSAGTAVITATAGDGSGKTGSCTIYVNAPEEPQTPPEEPQTPQEEPQTPPEEPQTPPEEPQTPVEPQIIKVSSIGLNKTSTTIIKGGKDTLAATVLPSDANEKGIAWSSSNEYIVTVDSAGVITGHHAGQAVIMATAKDGSGKSANCTVYVGVPNVSVNYRTHIQNVGWESTYRQNGAMSGTAGRALRLEAIQINVSGNAELGIQYVTHCQDYGWLSWSSDDEVNGTSGESKRLEAIEIKLTGADKDMYDVYYRVHAQNVGWLGWAKNGEPAGTAGYSRRLEGIQIFVVKKGQAIDSSYQGIVSQYIPAYLAQGNSSSYVAGSDSVHTAYQTHVQNIGWQSWRYDGAMSGTSGQSKRLEGINIKLTNKDYSGSVCYTTHVQNIGWQGNENNPETWKRDGEMAGTSGRSLRLEAIRICLTGEIAKHYDIYYRVHAQNVGWMGWAKNGEAAGTAGYSYRLEGIEIRLVPKGSVPPGSTAGRFIKR